MLTNSVGQEPGQCMAEVAHLCSRMSGTSTGKTQPIGVTQQQAARAIKRHFQFLQMGLQSGLVTRASITTSPCDKDFLTGLWLRGVEPLTCQLRFPKAASSGGGRSCFAGNIITLHALLGWSHLRLNSPGTGQKLPLWLGTGQGYMVEEHVR